KKRSLFLVWHSSKHVVSSATAWRRLPCRRCKNPRPYDEPIRLNGSLLSRACPFLESARFSQAQTEPRRTGGAKTPTGQVAFAQFDAAAGHCDRSPVVRHGVVHLPEPKVHLGHKRKVPDRLRDRERTLCRLKRSRVLCV